MRLSLEAQPTRNPPEKESMLPDSTGAVGQCVIQFIPAVAHHQADNGSVAVVPAQIEGKNRGSCEYSRERRQRARIVIRLMGLDSCKIVGEIRGNFIGGNLSEILL